MTTLYLTWLWLWSFEGQVSLLLATVLLGPLFMAIYEWQEQRKLVARTTETRQPRADGPRCEEIGFDL